MKIPAEVLAQLGRITQHDRESVREQRTRRAADQLAAAARDMLVALTNPTEGCTCPTCAGQRRLLDAVINYLRTE